MNQIRWANRKFTLTQRALLTFLGSMLVQAAEFLTGFFITPFIIRGIGQELYGAWGMIQQIIMYFSMTDFRSSTALEFLLGLRQHDENLDSKRRLIGASLMLWGISLPVAVLLGMGIVFLAPYIIRTSPVNQAPVRIALIVLLVNSVIDRLLAIPMHILRAQNLDYVGMGVNTLTVLGGGVLSALAIWLGFGLPGLAVATIINVLLISIGRFYVAGRALPWISVILPSLVEFFAFIKTSGWLLFIGLGGMLTYTSDTILVGYFLGPSTAAVYVTTGVVMRLVGETMFQVTNSGNPGLIGLCGQRDWERVASVRKEMYFVLIFLLTVLGTGIITLNRSFLSLWVGPQFYGGPALTIGLVLSMLVFFMARIDLPIVEAMLFLREKTWAFFGAGLIVVFTSILFINLWGTVGMAVSTFLGNLFLLVTAWILTGRRLGHLSAELLLSLVRPVVVMLLLFGSAFLLESRLIADSWMIFGLYTLITGSVVLLIGWLFVLPKNIRSILIARAKQNIPFLRKGSSG